MEITKCTPQTVDTILRLTSVQLVRMNVTPLDYSEVYHIY